MPATVMDSELLTTPQAATAAGIALDRLRKLVRRHPDIANLFEHVGPVRVIRADRLDELKAAVKVAG